jgi:nicotinamide phosphoribosyltransferase|nr:MAG TPA: putative nicotinate phosphoribosyltransferase [Crassvirales sp.]
MDAILLTDGYKLDHRRQYPEGTQFVYSNWTPRSCAYYPEAEEGVVVFGIQYFIMEYLIEKMQKSFFEVPKTKAASWFKRRIDTFLGPDNQVGTKHIEALWDLGYLPIKIKALPEGSLCPIRVPALTLINTMPEFFWLTNYLETLISTSLWLPMTSATSARLYKKELLRHAKKTGFENDFLGFMVHDFSMRGMAGVEAAIMSGMAHLTSFVGSETIPAIEALEEYYFADADKELIAATVPATEHSVMCAGGKEDEFETFRRLITEVYPKGFISIVSDTWDFWQVITDYVPRLKEDILAREGRVIIRPDSGVPEDIICGVDPAKYTKEEYEALPEHIRKGAYECLWDVFGGRINSKGYKVLDSHIGMIYGDSITLERQKTIYARLEAKGFAATNLVLGVGSYTYQYKSRDSLGFAMKATWCQVNGEGREIFKDPKTDDGVKKSLKGLIKVNLVDGKYVATDQVTKEEEDMDNQLETVFINGELVVRHSLEEIRKRVDESLS